MRIKILVCFAVCLLGGCGYPAIVQYEPLSAKQPYVVSVVPENKSSVAKLENINITFSHPIDPVSVNGKSILVVQDFIEPQSQEELNDQLGSKDLITVESLFEVSDDAKTVSCVLSGDIALDKIYGVVITNNIFTKEKIPLNQTPGGSPTMFWSVFELVGDAMSLEGVTPDGDINISTDEVVGAEPAEVREKAQVVINEILYDAAGSDTDGNVFIELYGNPGDDISGYEIVMADGDSGKITHKIIIPNNSIISENGFFVIADSKDGQKDVSNILEFDLLANFDPQNGPDAVQLLDFEGVLVDVVGYGSELLDVAENGFEMYENKSAPDVKSGFSLSRVVAGLDSNDNSVDFIANSKSSPGSGEVAPIE